MSLFSKFRREVFLVSTVCFAALSLAGCGRPAPEPQRRAARSEYRSTAISPYATTYQPSVVVTAPQQAYVEPYSSGITYEPAPVAAVGSGNRTVILDAGHGGHDEGASHFGLREKDVNLDLAHRTANILRGRGYNVVMTRSSDVFVPLPERSATANRNPNATLVSIHVNAADGNPGVCGVETYVLSSDVPDHERGRMAAARFKANGMDSVQGKQALANLAAQSSSRGRTLAASLQRSLCGRLGEPDRGVKQKDLAVLRETYFGPAALVEVGFMTNPQSAARMRTQEWRQRTSEAIADGIANFIH